ARLARQVVDSAPIRTGMLLDEISAQVDDALQTLRALARGIFPPVLADRGLAPALRAHLTRSGVSARLEADDSVARALRPTDRVRTVLLRPGSATERGQAR